MKKFLLFSSLYCAVSIGQVTNQIDSLNAIINNPENDSVLCSAVYHKGEISEKSNPSMALQLFEKCLHLAESNNYNELELNSLNSLGRMCFNIGASDKACSYYRKVIEKTDQYQRFYDIKCKSLINLNPFQTFNQAFPTVSLASNTT